MGRVNRTRFRPAIFGDGQVSPVLASVGDDGVVAVQKVGGDSHHSR